MRSRAIFLVVCSVAGLHVWAGTEYPAKPGDQVVANELIIRLMPGAAIGPVIAGALPGAQVQALGRERLFRISVPGGIPSGISARIAADLQVDYVEPNRLRHTTVAAPNDPNYAASWWFQTVQAVQAWSLLPGQYLTAATAGSGRVKVAILDTGADCTHPDFINSGGTSTNSAQGGQLMFSASQAFVTTTIGAPACSWQDDNGHGTHVTGIVAAATSNAIGVSGLGYPVQAIEYKVLDSAGSGSDVTIANAIMAAADAGAQVVSMSLGGAGYSQSLQTAVNYAWQRNTLVVAAAGNSASSSLFFPAGANHAVGVSATDSGNNLASFSNFGNSVQLAAPGVGILSTAPTYPVSTGWNNYVSLSGTSMATPFVSALAGLVAMSTPNTTAQAILQRMEQTASSNTAGGGWGQNFGYGIINASKAVAGTLRAAANGAIVGQIVNTSGNPIGGAQITINSQIFTTDSFGLYRFGTLPAGTYPVTVSAASFTTQNLSATVTPGADTPFTVTMGVTYGRFTGAVTDQGLGVSGAIVQALSGGLIAAVAIADPTGQYTLWVPGGTYDLRASAIGRNTTTITALTVSAGGIASANMILPRMGTISGTVRDGNLNPVASAQVLVAGGSFSAAATTDASGNYSLIGVPSGNQFSATATATGFLPSTQNGIAISADAATNVNFTMVSSAVAAPSFSLPGGSYATAQAVTITTTTSGASIRYTLDNTIPTATNGILYTGSPVSIASTLTLQAIAFVGASSSPVTSATYIISSGGGQVADPVISPPGGTFAGSVSVTMTSATPGATIRYTLDGSTPTANSPAFISPLTLTSSGWIRARAFAAGMTSSGIVECNFSITPGTTVTAPTFAPPGGSYATAQGVTITTTTSGASIRYTLDNTIPTATNGILSNGSPVSIASTATLQAIAYLGASSSPVTSATYIIGSGGGQVADPVVSPPGGSFTGSASVNMTSSTPGAVIHYTLDGTAPTASSPVFTGSLVVTSSGWVRARAMQAGMTSSGIVEYYFSITAGATVAAPTFSLPGGSYATTLMVNISTTTSGASIRYTLDNTVPTATNGILSNGSPVSIASTATLQAIAYLGASSSPVTSATYIIGSGGGQVADPVVSPPGGSFTGSASVNMTSSTPGAVIHYTLDGTAPTASSPVFTGSLVVASSGWVRARAMQAGMTSSGIVEYYFSITAGATVAAPTFSLPGGSYATTLMVNISTTTSGASIRYTLDNTVPTATNGILSNGSPVSIASTATLQAIAYLGASSSPVTSATYIIGSGGGQVADPVVSPPGGSFTGSASVNMTSSTPGAVIHYTLDGTAPTASSPVFTGSLVVTSSGWVRARAMQAGMTSSGIVEYYFSIQ